MDLLICQEGKEARGTCQAAERAQGTQTVGHRNTHGEEPSAPSALIIFLIPMIYNATG